MKKVKQLLISFCLTIMLVLSLSILSDVRVNAEETDSYTLDVIKLNWQYGYPRDAKKLIFTDIECPTNKWSWVSVNSGDVRAWMIGDTFYVSSCVEGQKIYLPEDSSAVFQNFFQLESIDFSNLDFSKVKIMDNMFKGYQGDYLEVPACKPTSMQNMFCGSVSIDLSNVDTSELKSVNSMFEYCLSLENVNWGENWNPSKVEDFEEMFYFCENLEELDLSSWNTSSATNMSKMFKECYNLKELDLSSWDTSNVTNMSEMFKSCYKLKELDLTSWDTSGLQNSESMFEYCKSLEILKLSEKFIYNKGMKYPYPLHLVGTDKYYGTENNAVNLPGELIGGTYRACYNVYIEYPDSDKKDVKYVYWGASLKDIPIPEREYYTSIKWWHSEGDVVDDAIVDHVHIFPVYEPVQYKITFDANDGSGKTEEISYHHNKEIVTNEYFERKYYEFKGWATSKDGEVKYEKGFDIKDTPYYDTPENVTLYAIWKPINYKITLFSGSNDGQQKILNYNIESDFNITANFNKENYIFSSWLYGDTIFKENCNVKEIINFTLKVNDDNLADVKLYGQWKYKQYKVTLIKNNGSKNVTLYYNLGNSQDIPLIYTKKGYRFVGWKLEETGKIYYKKDYVEGVEGEGLYTFHINRDIGYSDMILKAVWKPVNYKITFKANGGKGSMSSQKYNIESTGVLNANKFTRQWYKFKGWKVSGGSRIYSNKTSIKNILKYNTPKNITLHAQWERNIPVGSKVTINGIKYKVTGATSVAAYDTVKTTMSSASIPNYIKIAEKIFYVTKVNQNTFKDCKKLKKVTIGTAVTKMESYVFNNCSNLKTIIIKSKKITGVKSKTFADINKNAKIKVEASKYKAYSKLFKKKGQKSTVKIVKM